MLIKELLRGHNLNYVSKASVFSNYTVNRCKSLTSLKEFNFVSPSPISISLAAIFSIPVTLAISCWLWAGWLKANLDCDLGPLSLGWATPQWISANILLDCTNLKPVAGYFTAINLNPSSNSEKKTEFMEIAEMHTVQFLSSSHIYFQQML